MFKSNTSCHWSVLIVSNILLLYDKWDDRDLNPKPLDYESSALTY